MNAVDAVVLGDIDLVRPLALAGVRCAAVAPPEDPVGHSRFVAERMTPPQDWDDASFVVRLLEYGRSQPTPPVLYYQYDEHLLFVSRNRDVLGEAFRFVIPERGHVEDCLDKARFQALAERLGLAVPPTRIINPIVGSHPPARLDYPLILKPVQRSQQLWGPIESAKKVLRIDSPAQLEALWPRLVDVGHEMLAQCVVQGPETRLESYHYYIDSLGRTAAEFTGRKIRTRPVEYGHTTALTTADLPDVAEAGRAVIAALGLGGVGKVDFKRAPDGRLVLLEVNPRFSLWHYPGALAGCNIPALVQADLSDRARPPLTAATGEVRWCSLDDAKAFRDWGVSLPRWIGWVLRCEAKEVWTASDPLPLVHFVRTQVAKRASTAAQRLLGRLACAVRGGAGGR